MYYSLNDYLPLIGSNDTRILVYPNNPVGAKIVAEYKGRNIRVASFHELFSSIDTIPTPSDAIRALQNYTPSADDLVLWVGIDAYLEFLTGGEKKDFFQGLLPLLDGSQCPSHFLISSTAIKIFKIDNPKYESAAQLVYFNTMSSAEEDDITTEPFIEEFGVIIVPERWGKNYEKANSFNLTLKSLGNYIPSGRYFCWMPEKSMPWGSLTNITVIRTSKEALELLYGWEINADSDLLDLLLQECNNANQTPEEYLTTRFGGEDYLICENAPARLVELKEDEFWKLFLELLKSRIKQDSYLRYVLQRDLTSDNFLEEYVVYGAKDALGHKNAQQYAEERKNAIIKLKVTGPQIARFVSETEDDFTAIRFLNCGTHVEKYGLIRKAAKYDLAYTELPDEFNNVIPDLLWYLAPSFDYGNKQLTDYFARLRCLRIKNSIDADFVKDAFDFNVPAEVFRRDKLLALYDDGETALLVVDGLGAEFYPLLLNLAHKGNLKVEEKRIVSVNLPTSTEFNSIEWSEENRLREEKQVDNLSHEGCSKYEKCSYEEILVELFSRFKETILVRIGEGLTKYKRVIVTGDHGSSYLAVLAYQKGMVRNIPWEDPQDWRYTSCSLSIDVSDDLEVVYRPDEERTYYVVRGYNRFQKSGGKLYALHGGATLEERLVPFIVFSNSGNESTLPKTTLHQIHDSIDNTTVKQNPPVSQFEENDDFANL